MNIEISNHCTYDNVEGTNDYYILKVDDKEYYLTYDEVYKLMNGIKNLLKIIKLLNHVGLV